MSIKKTIQKAIEGGWKYRLGNTIIWREMKNNLVIVEIFLDPQFWQGLGNTMGWGKLSECHNAETYRSVHTFKNGNTYLPDWYDFCKECKNPCKIKGEYEDWKFYWHSFIDHLADGKTAEDYFKNLSI